MSLKRRIFLSNIFTGIFSVIFVIILSTIMFLNQENIKESNGFDESTLKEHLSITSSQIETMIKEGASSDEIANTLKLDNIEGAGIYIEEDGKEKYISENITSEEKNLIMLLKENPEIEQLSTSNYNLATDSFEVEGKTFTVYGYIDFQLVVSNLEESTANWRVLIIALGLIFTIIINRFLTKFVFKKINEPLNILVSGVDQIKNGNLDVKLVYKSDDEFAKVIDSFNEMTIKLKEIKEIERKYEEDRKELLLGVTHDLRTPLTSIQAYVEGLIDGVAKTPEMEQKYLKTIKEKSITIQRMISQIIQFSKPDLETYSLDMKERRIDKEIEKFLGDWGEEYKLSGLEIIPKYTPVTAWIDSEKLKTILTNIADNSLKYKNKEKGILIISFKEEKEYVTIELADDGPGVNEDSIEKLFDMFYRDDKARRHTDKGSGIGLAIVKKIVNKMEGTVTAKNINNSGLQIDICLKKEVKNEKNPNY